MIKKIVLVVGARPNFMKSAPLIKELQKHTNKFNFKLIHTGQHYDKNLSQLFFEQLNMPKPDLYLGVGSGSHAEQTAKIMLGIEKALYDLKPDLVIVFGDVNSTAATAMVTSKMGLKLAHIEAGLRSFDRSMPEEINRIVTDHLSDFLFVSEKSGMKNLLNEGIGGEKVFFAGNIMIDSLIGNMKLALESNVLKSLELSTGKYILVTLHRPATVDSAEQLKSVLEALKKIGDSCKIIFPCHPRTKQRIIEFGLSEYINDENLKIIDPLGYLDFLKLQIKARMVITDSGGIQEETTYLGVPCITVRHNTERPITVEIGTNIIASTDPQNIIKIANDLLNAPIKKGKIPEYWDGKTSERIVGVLINHIFRFN